MADNFMAEQDFNKLSGETIDDQEREEIAEVKSQLHDIVRIRKGLPGKPEQFDVQTISQLTDAVIDDSSPTTENALPSAKIYNKGQLPLPEYARRLRLKRANQLKNQPQEKAA